MGEQLNWRIYGTTEWSATNMTTVAYLDSVTSVVKRLIVQRRILRQVAWTKVQHGVVATPFVFYHFSIVMFSICQIDIL